MRMEFRVKRCVCLLQVQLRLKATVLRLLAHHILALVRVWAALGRAGTCTATSIESAGACGSTPGDRDAVPRTVVGDQAPGE